MDEKDKRSDKNQGKHDLDADTATPLCPNRNELPTSRKPVSQTDLARGIRQALITATLREGFRVAFQTLMENFFGVDVDIDPQPLALPEVEDLFDDIDVVEPMETPDPE